MEDYVPGTSFSRALLVACTLAAMAGPLPALAAIGTQQPASNTPSGLGDLLRQARKAMADGHPNVAVIYLKNAAALAPQNADVRTELGYAYLRSADAVSALRELRTARQMGAPEARVLPLLYDAMLARRDGKALLEQFPAPAASDHSPLAAATLRARGIALMDAGDAAAARVSLDSALAIGRDVPTLVVRSKLARQENDTALAARLGDEAYAKAPKDQTVLLLRIANLQATGKFPDALRAADTAVSAYPDSPAMRLARAGVLMQLRNDAKARQDVDAVLAQAKKLPQALYFSALLKERAKDPKGAWMIAQALPPEFTTSRADTGLMVARMAAAAGQNDVAITILASTVARFPGTLEPRITLAAMYLRDKNSKRALDVLLPARDSSDARVMLLTGQAYAMAGQSQQATEFFQKATRAEHGGALLKRQLAANSVRSGDVEGGTKQLQELFSKTPSDQVTAGMLIAVLSRSGDLAGAGRVADKFAAAAPKDPYGSYYQGQILHAQGKLKEAVKAFDRAAALDRKFALAYYDRAAVKAALGDLSGADSDAGAVLRLQPKNAMAMIRSAEIALRRNDAGRAERLLVKASRENPASAAPQLALSSFYLSRKRINDASAVITAYLKRAPDDADARALRAETDLAAGRTKEALQALQPLARKYPNSAELQLLLANAFAAAKNTGNAVSAYQKSLQLSPGYALARTALVRYALSIGKTGLALDTAAAGIKADPGANAHILYASTLLTLKKLPAATEAMKSGFSRYPTETGAILYSQILRQGGKGQEADGILLRWANSHPGDYAARLELAQQAMATRRDAAEAQLRAVLKADPDNMVALNNLAYLLQRSDTKAALAFAEHAARLAPQSPQVQDTLGWTKWLAKDANAALPLLEKAHKGAPDDAEIAYHLATVQNALGKHAEAKKTLTKALASPQEFSERQAAMALKVKLR